MTSKPVEGRKYSANLPGFNNLEENRKGKQIQLKIILPSTTILSYTFYRFQCHYPLITYLNILLKQRYRNSNLFCPLKYKLNLTALTALTAQNYKFILEIWPFNHLFLGITSRLGCVRKVCIIARSVSCCLPLPSKQVKDSSSWKKCLS